MAADMRIWGGAAGLVAALAIFVPAASAATIEPNVTADGLGLNGNCTLREAIQAANTNTAVDACHKGGNNKLDTVLLKQGEYTLTLAGDEDLNAGGDLDVLAGGPLQIRGRGMGKTTIDPPASGRAVDAGDVGNTRLTLKRLTVEGGDAGLRGGAIRTDDTGNVVLVLERVRVRDGEAQFGGGLGLVGGKLRVSRSIFVGNRTIVGTTGLPAVHAIGGAMNLLFDVEFRIVDTTFEDNDAVANDSTASGGAIALVGSGERGVIRRSLFTGNDAYSSTANAAATRRGGALFMESSGAEQGLRIVNSTFFGNRAIGAGSAARGGAVFGLNGTAQIANSTFLANQATNGSALYVDGASLKLSRSVLEGAGPLCGLGAGSWASKGYNVATPAPFGCDFDGPKDKLADPLLAAAPAANGGATKTVRLGKGSPAVNRIPQRKCKPAEGVDQRRFKRPAGKRCDSGAYERGAKPR
jgi:CSLREA domain-containing protein